MNPALFLGHAESRKKKKNQPSIPSPKPRCALIISPKNCTSFRQSTCSSRTCLPEWWWHCWHHEPFTVWRELNPVNFSRHRVFSMALFEDGTSVPSQPLMLDFGNEEYIQAYTSIFRANGSWGTDGNPANVEYDNFPHGFCFFVLSLQDKRPWFSSLKKAHCGLPVRFATPPEEPLTMLIYSSYPDAIQIDATRTVT